MRVLFLNCKIQAFYITFLVFVPLFFTMFWLNDFFKMEFKSEETFALAMRQFIQTSQEEIKAQNSMIEQRTQEEIKTQHPITEQTLPKAQEKSVKKEKPTPKLKNTPILAHKENTPQEANLKNIHEETKPLSQSKHNHLILEKIQKAIEQAQIYPKAAQKMRLQGVVKVEFLWGENRTLSNLRIVESSGYDLLDKSALESIKKASLNFPHYDKNLKITLPIVYNFKILRG